MQRIRRFHTSRINRVQPQTMKILPAPLLNRPPGALRRRARFIAARGAGGFTIIELMIVMVVLAVLIAIAAPSLRTMIVGNAVRSITGDLQSDIAMSRSEASKRSQRVVLCASTNLNTCTGATSWARAGVLIGTGTQNDPL